VTDQSRDKPAKPPPKPDRAAREAAALRANLLKRKDQARRREETPKAVTKE
jgi:hypothetical protein